MIGRLRCDDSVRDIRQQITACQLLFRSVIPSYRPTTSYRSKNVSVLYLASFGCLLAYYLNEKTCFLSICYDFFYRFYFSSRYLPFHLFTEFYRPAVCRFLFAIMFTKLSLILQKTASLEHAVRSKFIIQELLSYRIDFRPFVEIFFHLKLVSFNFSLFSFTSSFC